MKHLNMGMNAHNLMFMFFIIYASSLLYKTIDTMTIHVMTLLIMTLLIMSLLKALNTGDIINNAIICNSFYL